MDDWVCDCRYGQAVLQELDLNATDLLSYVRISIDC